MARKSKARTPATDDVAELKIRLEETEETLRAIRQYMVDAFVVTRANGIEVVTLNEADYPYRVMVESMNEGAVTLIPDGTIFYCNPRFAEMVGSKPDKLIGEPFQDLVVSEQQAAFAAFFKQRQRTGTRAEFCLKCGNDEICLPVQLSLYLLSSDGVSGVSIIATDIKERVQAEQKIRSLASDLTRAEREERHRISQVLHDDLQQRLFAARTQLSMLSEGEGVLTDSARHDLEQIQHWLSDAITVTRNLSVDLSPAVLRGEGLHEAIGWLATQMKDQYGLEVQVQASPDFPKFDDTMRVLLFQATRELLFNTVKHSGTSAASVRLERAEYRARITVSDEGRGFDAGTVLNDPNIAHGLLIIQNRLALMGCTMQVSSAPGRGTRVIIEVPPERPSVRP